MSLATIQSRALLGVDALEVTVETHLPNGLPAFAIVGLPETAGKESKERARSAIINSGLDFPTRRITINLAQPIYRRQVADTISPLLSASSSPRGN